MSISPTFDELYNKLSRLCSRTEYCKADIMRKLYRYDNDIIDKQKLIDKLIDEGFINEARYAKAFVHDKLLFTRWSKERIEYELQVRRISSEDIKNAFAEQ